MVAAAREQELFARSQVMELRAAVKDMVKNLSFQGGEFIADAIHPRLLGSSFRSAEHLDTSDEIIEADEVERRTTRESRVHRPPTRTIIDQLKLVPLGSMSAARFFPLSSICLVEQAWPSRKHAYPSLLFRVFSSLTLGANRKHAQLPICQGKVTGEWSPSLETMLCGSVGSVAGGRLHSTGIESVPWLSGPPCNRSDQTGKDMSSST